MKPGFVPLISVFAALAVGCPGVGSSDGRNGRRQCRRGWGQGLPHRDGSDGGQKRRRCGQIPRQVFRVSGLDLVARSELSECGTHAELSGLHLTELARFPWLAPVGRDRNERSAPKLPSYRLASAWADGGPIFSKSLVAPRMDTGFPCSVARRSAVRVRSRASSRRSTAR
jgi:hypothetical protein